MGRFLDEIFFLSPPYRSTEERLTKGNNLPAFLVLSFFFIFIIRNKRLSPPCRKVWLYTRGKIRKKKNGGKCFIHTSP
jgi:hypothetical protein